MSEIGDNSALSRVLADYSLADRGKETAKNNDMGRSEFLKLLVAQLENQDPTKPQENGEFVSQLAQFSSLEEQQKMSTSFSDFSTSFQSTQHLQATSLVGRPVHVLSNVTALTETGGVSVIADIPHATGNAQLSVFNSNGSKIDSFELGPQAEGRAEFLWTGFDANDQRFPPGMYSFSVEVPEGDQSKALPIFLSANVNSVTIEPGGGLTLNLAGVGPTPLADVIQIN
jgi:flagellar basal-body rod modification protein FlgD